MCASRSFFASSMYGLFSSSDSAFHCVPSRLLISELCIFGFSSAIFFLILRDQTMNAFIGLLTLSSSSSLCGVCRSGSAGGGGCMAFT